MTTQTIEGTYVRDLKVGDRIMSYSYKGWEAVTIMQVEPDPFYDDNKWFPNGAYMVVDSSHGDGTCTIFHSDDVVRLAN
jgi:hypothetical protein